MKKNFFKRGMAGLLSLVMCLTALVGIGTTTAYAAGERAEVYLVSFPRSGDANIDYSGTWGHPNLRYMNGWHSGESKYTTIRAMLDTAPIDVSTVEELPSPNMGAFYKNEDQTLYIKRDIGDSVALCQCVAQELGHAQLAMNCEAYSRRDMGFSAVCVGYMLCRKFGVDVKNFAIDRIPEELAGKSPKEIRAELSKTRSAMSEIGSRVSEEIYRRRADRSKDQER